MRHLTRHTQSRRTVTPSRLFYQITLEIDEELKRNEFLEFIRNCIDIKATSNGKEKVANRISSCEPDGHRIINTRLCSFCK